MQMFESRNGLFFAFRGLSTYRLKVVRLWICILTHPLVDISLLRLIVFLADHRYLVDQLSIVEGVEASGGLRRLLFAAERLYGVEMLEQEETGVGVGGAKAERFPNGFHTAWKTSVRYSCTG